MNTQAVERMSIETPLPTDLSEVGPFVREKRQQHGIGLREFAKRTGIAPSNLCNYEQGRKAVGADVAAKLLAPFGISVRVRLEISAAE